MRLARSLAALVLAPFLLAACGDDDSTTGAADGIEGRVTVLAATSLKGAFEDIETACEDEHPGAVG
jgi:ABC-type molybdate transport system substrate-binding protein